MRVPFVPNSSDNLHCVPAALRMVSKFYFGKDFTWEEMDKILRVEPGKATWIFPGLTELANQGLQITNIEPIDYKRLYKEGLNSLYKMVGKETADYYIYKSNLPNIIQLIPDYLKVIRNHVRRSKVDELVDCLSDGKLIGVEVNSSILNNKDGFNLHYIILYDFDGKNIIFHDPGLPPVEGRKIFLEDFEKAFDYVGSNGGITIFSK
jgi:hypothetical protein